MNIIIHLVDDKNHWTGGASNLRGEIGIQRRNAINRIGHKKNHVGTLHRNEGALPGALGKIRIGLGANATGIHNLKGRVTKFADRSDAVARDARLIVDNGNHSPGKAVEKGGLPDIRASNDGDVSHG